MKKLILSLVMMMTAIFSFGNNIVISNISIINNGPGNIQVQFDISWNNSWRVVTGPNNYDGAWVFFKYKTAGGNWVHLTLTGLNNVAPAGSEIYQTSGNRYGAMIYRSSSNTGTGSVNFITVKLGVSDALPYNVNIKGFAAEMVFIPPVSGLNAGVVLGDGDGVNENSRAFHTTDNLSTTLNSTGTTLLKTDANTFDDATLTGTGITIGTSVGISGSNAFFPIGSSVWCMKYEVTQAGYRDFLNTLTLAQQINRTQNAPTSATGTSALTTNPGNFRMYIEIATPSSGGNPAVYGCDASSNNIYDEANDGEWVACNYLGWVDLAAWLDWAGLAPMTEIDYERICRGFTSAGPNESVFGEYAWGTNTIFGSLYTLITAATTTETASNASTTLGNAFYDITAGGVQGPSRAGIFATGASNRITSGSSFYGVMELSGNVFEQCVTVANIAGRSFTGINGDGVLSSNGNANTTAWPCGNNSSIPASCSEVTDTRGTILRDGGFAFANSYLQVSYRASGQGFISRSHVIGGRGVLYAY